VKRYLLDTHVWLWSLLEPDRLGNTARNELEDETNEVFLSPVTLWESLILGEKGRVELRPDPLKWVRDSVEKSPLMPAVMNYEVALVASEFRLHHRDPADTFILATAKVYGLTLITADSALLKSKLVSCLRAVK